MIRRNNQYITRAGIIYLVLFAALMILILVFSGFSGEISSSQSGFVVDVLNAALKFFGINLNADQLDIFAYVIRKLVGHFLLFLLDGLFAYLALNNMTIIKNKWLRILVAGGAMLLVAGSSELIQLFTSGRSGNLYDVGIDLSGALLGIAIAFLITFQRKEKAEIGSAS
ncbi:MAG: VanZ family protein [Bacilli bacterium]|jgi:VanZ family protein